MSPLLLQLLVIFAEPGFPVVDAPPALVAIDELVAPEQLIVARSVAELEVALRPGRVLVWRHGSAFPAEAWPALLRFLEEGGSLLQLGGEPFTRPVLGAPGERSVGPRTVSLLKELRLNQCTRIDVGGMFLRRGAGEAAPETPLPAGAWVGILQPRFSDTKDFDHEDGAPGARDAILRPLSHVLDPGDPRFPVAAASIAIDRLRGRFHGGRWVFRLLSTAPERRELEQLIGEARRSPADLRVDPTYGCYHEGERPSVNVRLHRPRARELETLTVDLDVTGPGGEIWSFPGQRLAGRTHAVAAVPLEIGTRPGLYRVTATVADLEPATTGFWIFDRELFESGGELSFDGYTLRRDGEPEPVVGTTVMSATVHRKFLFEPNAAVWDDTFAELASLHMNLVRTGVWSAYRKISLDPHVIDEAWLRALEAFYLSARRHGIPVLFTFFAFVPESFGGASPYFDPRALEGQRAYLQAVASRFAGAREMLWDLINEPSFASPDKLWLCRPHGDPFEAAAFRRWLEERYSRAPAGRAGWSWEDVVRARWRLLPGDRIGVPADSDFDDRQVIGVHRPYRAKEFAHFGQDAFAAWVRTMAEAIRDGGSRAPITVGQDEGGLLERPSPLFHHREVDFTSMHTWWFNDALLWDGLMAKAPGKPLLFSETGIMERELLSGEPLRDPEESARLLSRKIGHVFASGGFGIVQWCYEVNPYMDSDNEVAIGLERVDGSYKPEHRVLREFAAFVARNRQYFVNPADPEVVVLFPSGDHYSPRGLQKRGTQRAVEILGELGVPLRIVPEYCTGEDLGTPRLIFLPACRGLSEGAWQDLRQAVERGAVLHCCGWFETDDAGLPARRLGASRRALARVEELAVGDVASEPSILRFPLEVMESWYAADRSASAAPRPSAMGRGWIVHHALPLEWAEPSDVQRRCYESSLRAAGVETTPVAAGLLVRRIPFAEATLVVAINESSRARTLTEGSLAGAKVPPGWARMYLVTPAGELIDRSHVEEAR